MAKPVETPAHTAPVAPVAPTAPVIPPVAANGAAPAEGTATAPTGDAPAATTEEKKPGSKTRAARGVPEGHKTAWVPYDYSPEMGATIAKVAHMQKKTTLEVLGDCLKWAITQYESNFAGHVAQYEALPDAEKKARSGGRKKSAMAKKVATLGAAEAQAFLAEKKAAAEKAVAEANALLAQYEAQAAGTEVSAGS